LKIEFLGTLVAWLPSSAFKFLQEVPISISSHCARNSYGDSEQCNELDRLTNQIFSSAINASIDISPKFLYGPLGQKSCAGCRKSLLSKAPHASKMSHLCNPTSEEQENSADIRYFHPTLRTPEIGF